MRNKEATIKRILQSASVEFKKYGFEQASVRTIAKNAGVTPGAIYKHFESKEDIFRAIVNPTLEHLYKRNRENKMAGVLGFEPRDAEIKTRCLTAWRYPNDYLTAS